MEYATVEDYEARYGTLGESEADRVSVLLEDASIKVDALVARHGVDVDEKAGVLTARTCEYVHYKRQFAVGPNVAAVTHPAGETPGTSVIGYIYPQLSFLSEQTRYT